MGGKDELKSTEKWIFGTDSWISGEYLPEAVVASAAVNSNSEEIVGYLVSGKLGWFNGPTPNVWYLRRKDMTWNEYESKKVKTPRYWHTVVNIPGDQIPGC